MCGGHPIGGVPALVDRGCGNIYSTTIKTQNKLKYLGSMNDRSKIAYPWEGLETPDYKRSRRTVDITVIIKLVTIKTQKKLKYFGFTDDV